MAACALISLPLIRSDARDGQALGRRGELSGLEPASVDAPPGPTVLGAAPIRGNGYDLLGGGGVDLKQHQRVDVLRSAINYTNHARIQ